MGDLVAISLTIWLSDLVQISENLNSHKWSNFVAIPSKSSYVSVSNHLSSTRPQDGLIA